MDKTPLEPVIRVLKRMIEDRVILDCAMGGATAAMFYTEPVNTWDVDFFVVFPPQQGVLLTLEPLYTYLAGRGHRPKDECVMIHGVPVQFLPATGLTEEAVATAGLKNVGEEEVKVMKPEYLMAIMVQTGRAKDFLRLRMFFEQAVVDRELFKSLIRRHTLAVQWSKAVPFLDNP